ncbi:MAG: hypothetical protein KAS32_06290, partial [Candidatus Peribacteraceae bacterium]|nr:hypothetical protein [Candidatus Peribacteraceae bacterium]
MVIKNIYKGQEKIFKNDCEKIVYFIFLISNSSTTDASFLYDYNYMTRSKKASNNRTVLKSKDSLIEKGYLEREVIDSYVSQKKRNGKRYLKKQPKPIYITQFKPYEIFLAYAKKYFEEKGFRGDAFAFTEEEIKKMRNTFFECRNIMVKDEIAEEVEESSEMKINKKIWKNRKPTIHKKVATMNIFYGLDSMKDLKHIDVFRFITL